MPFPTYEIDTEITSQTLDEGRLDREIRASAISAPGLALFQGITSTGPDETPTHLTTLFSSTPTGPDQAVVDAVVLAHDGTVVDESDVLMVSLSHDDDHTINGVLSVPDWNIIQNEDPNVRRFQFPNPAKPGEVLCFASGLYRIRYGFTVMTAKDHEIVRCGVYVDDGANDIIVDGLDSEVTLRNTGSDRGVLTADHAVRLDAGSSVSPYLYTTSGDDATIIAHSASWSIQFVTARGGE